jgi:hypothetical protein
LRLIVHKPSVNPNWATKGTYVASVDEKREWILENEHQLAGKISREIIHKPELNIWMIIIPVIFVYFFFQLNRSVSAKKEFVKNFVLTRKNILNKARASSVDEEKPDFEEMAKSEKVPDCAVEAYKTWANVLFEHYQKLLNEKGDSYAELVRRRYENRDRYLLILERISKAENKFYQALRKDLDGSVKNAGDVIQAMEKSLPLLRYEEADGIFKTAGDK